MTVSTHAPEADEVDGKGVRLALVTARFHGEITDRMRLRASAEAVALGCVVVVDVRVPGVYDLPLAVDAALGRPDVDAAVVLGAVVTGETGHDELIAHAAARSLTDLALKHGKPVGLGVTGPRQDRDQAKARVDRAESAVRSAVVQVRTVEAVRAIDA
jgi:6,7-dimethyl-8-ribityllumazine synthase